jgi:hypothetical protein
VFSGSLVALDMETMGSCGRIWMTSPTSAKEGKLTELELKRKPWENALTNSVLTVDVLFTKYMAELGCTGEVKLVKGEESENTDAMGSFRD